jgi:plasmid stability protein
MAAGTEEEVRNILSNAMRDEEGAPARLGSRIAARFAGIGLDEEIPELRGQWRAAGRCTAS